MKGYSREASLPANASVPPVDHSVYPLQWQLGALGLVGALAVGILSGSPLLAFSLFVLCCGVGMLWRDGEPPVLAFCLAYQWLFAVTGYCYLRLTGVYPGLPVIGNLEAAVLYSQVGFLALSLGVRAGFFLLRNRHGSPAPAQCHAAYDIQRLFWWVIGMHAIDWFIVIAPRAVAFNAAQVIQNLLAFRTVLLCVLFLEVLRRNRGYAFGVAALLYVLIPLLASPMSMFKELFFLLFVIILSQWRPWASSPTDRRRSIRVGAMAATLACALLLAGLIWEGGIKPAWRPAVMSGAGQGSTMERVADFLSISRHASVQVQPVTALQALAMRVSSGAGYFSLVIERVPRVIAHENGALTGRAVTHIMKPRFLFPEKPSLRSDSQLVVRYAGLHVAGEAQQTSIGLGYMAQFFIDFGAPGMFIALVGYGVLWGLLCAGLRRVAPSQTLYGGAVAVMVLQHLSNYDGEVAKQLGGFVQTFLVFGTLLAVAGPWLHRHLACPEAGPAPVNGRPRTQDVR